MNKALKPTRVFLGLGSNLGRRVHNLRRALDALQKRCGVLVACSDFIATQPEGFCSNNLFLNAVCELNTTLLPIELLHTTQTIEREMGRTVKSHDGEHFDRIIDIDILWMDGVQIDTPALTIPHKHLCKRRFVLEPFCQIAPDLTPYPEGPTISQLLASLE
ncbi:MAG: 2-amino-4-hydroxy-6-hydroxymethyldihydropteridine diphosphokinase [Alloprevotella sp.]|nr:2-amino-4-hydroxy-6-hydroxymethyldihydropteridine diphosphokinase [Alloprevotella sp.]